MEGLAPDQVLGKQLEEHRRQQASGLSLSTPQEALMQSLVAQFQGAAQIMAKLEARATESE
eukprot:11515223-Alexandrium_andersonii.AAC.1